MVYTSLKIARTLCRLEIKFLERCIQEQQNNNLWGTNVLET